MAGGARARFPGRIWLIQGGIMADDAPEKTASDPKVAALQERLHRMFARHRRNPLMCLLHDIAVKMAAEGKIRG